MTMIKQILKQDKKATQLCSHYDWSHLLSKTISLYTTEIFGATPSSSKLDFQDPNFKEQMKKATAAYLEENLNNFPRSNTLRLFIGYYYAKKLKLYELGIKHLRDAQNSSSSFIVALNSSLVLNSCQEELIKSSKGSDRALDMETYSRSRSIAAKMELSIIKQAELQEEIYQEMAQNPVNLGKIYQVAQVIKKQKDQARRLISKLLETIPEYYTDPLLTCAHYFACLNFDFEQSKKYQNLFSRRYAKYEKHFQSVLLCEENLYQRSNDVVVASSEKADLGITLYNSKTLIEGRGRDLKGLHFSLGVLPVLSNEIIKITRARIETGDRGIKGKIVPYYIYHFQNSHISPTLCCADTNPYLGNGVQDFMFSRLITLPVEHLVLLENGKMEYCTKGFADALNLDAKVEGNCSKKSEIRIKQICQEFERVNQAFNMVAFPEKYHKSGSELTLAEAQELYTLCTTTGKPFQFQSLTQTKWVSYHCKAQNFVMGSLFLKFVTLEKVIHQDDHDYDKILLQGQKNEEDVESDQEQEIVRIPTTYFRQKNTLITSKTTSQTENPLSTERESAAFLLTTQRNQSSPKKYSHIERLQSTEEDFEQHYHPHQRRFKKLLTKTTNHTQKETDRFEVNTAYKLAVNSKYYAPHYRLVTIFMYLLFIFLSIFQMISKATNNSNIANLDGQGQALLLLEQRGHDILSAHGLLTLLWEWATNFQDQTKFAPVLQMPTVAYLARPYAQTFATSNKNILSKVDFLPDYLQKELFEPSIKFYDDAADPTLYTNLNFFQSLDRLSETLLHGVDLSLVNLTSSVGMWEIYLHNDINDILSKNENLFEQFQDSVNLLAIQIKGESYVYLFVMVPLIGLVGFALFAFILDQYSKDKRNLFMITKVNQNQVQNIRNKISHLKNLLIQEEDIQKIDLEETYFRSKSGDSINKHSKGHWSGNNENTSQKQTEMGHLIKSYLRQASKLLVIWILLISFTIINYEIRKNTLDATRDSIDRLAHIYKINNKVVFPFVCNTEVLIQNSTTTVLNLPSQTVFLMSITQLKDLVTNLPTLFPSDDDSINPAIIESLYQDSCKYLDSADKEACREINKGLDSVGLLQFMVNYASSYDSLFQKYQASNKTQSSLARLQIEGFNSEIFPMMSSIAATCEFIRNILAENYQNTLNSGYRSSNINLAIISVILLVGCLVIHLNVIKTLKEAENRFRNILQTLPSELQLML